MQDNVADMLTRIRNAQAVHKVDVLVPYSKFKEKILAVLLDEGYISGFEVMGEGAKCTLLIILKYYNNAPVIKSITRISKSSLRHYVRAKNIKKVLNGLGVSILSTPKGVCTDRQARSMNVGGEILCNVY